MITLVLMLVLFAVQIFTLIRYVLNPGTNPFSSEYLYGFHIWGAIPIIVLGQIGG